MPTLEGGAGRTLASGALNPNRDQVDSFQACCNCSQH